MSHEKRIMFVMRKAPYGTRYALGGLEAALMMGAYEQDISILYIDDGIYALKKGMDTTDLEIKNFSPTYGALESYDIDKLYIDKESMDLRGLTLDDFVIELKVLERDEAVKLMEEQDVLFPF